MKILFLCGSFERGRDGVGDYVARFAAALTKRGHACAVAALADRYVTSPMTYSDGACEVARIPFAQWTAGKFAAAVDMARRFNPDWVSLQMVCYAYEPHGLLLRSPRRFAALAAGAKRHLMLHELWIGESSDYGAWNRLVGAVQKGLLLRAAQGWAADVVHTSNPTYRAMLRRCGVEARLLALPGNIPLVAPAPDTTARAWLLSRTGLREEGSERLFLAAVFGSIRPAWAAEHAWLAALANTCRDIGLELALLQIGRAGEAGAHAWRALREAYADRVRFRELGELPAGDLSVALQGIDLGVATSPWPLIGKSGTVAAMLEHGAPVVVTRDDFALRGMQAPDPESHPRLYRFGERFLAKLRSGGIRRGAPRTADAIYDDFVAGLSAAGAPGLGLARLPV